MVTFDHEHVPTDHLHALAAGGHRRTPGAGGARPRPGQGRDARGAGRIGAPCRGTASSRAVRRGRRLRLPVRPEDHAGRVRRQGRLVRRTAEECAPAFEAAARTGVRILAEELVRVPARAVGARGAEPERPGGGVPRRRVDPARRRLPRGDRAGARPRPRRARPAREALALRIAGELDVTGILAVELFETDDGGPGQRARDAPAQHRPLDPGRRRHLAVREPPARRARPAARRRRSPAHRGR